MNIGFDFAVHSQPHRRTTDCLTIRQLKTSNA